MIDVPLVLFIFHVAIGVTMRAATGLFAGFSQVAAPVVVSGLWQGAIVAAGLAFCMQLARRVSAGHRFAIWAAGFAALVCLPFLSMWIARAGASGSILTGSLAGAGSSGPWLRLDLRWSLVIGAAWIAASVFRAVALGIHSLRLRRLWKSATPIEGGDIVLSPLSSAAAERHGAPILGAAVSDRKAGRWCLRGVQVCTTKELDRPTVIGFLAPRILIPEWLFERLTPHELEHVVLHESEHLRRGDDWINLAQKLCLVAFPLNPALAWMERRLCSEREMACDEGVVRATKAPRAYAACLASLAERGLKHRADALSLGAWQRRPELVHRVHRILRRTPGLNPMATRALMGALSCGLVFGAIEFARCPQLVAFVPEPRTSQQIAAQRSAAAELGDARLVDASFGSGRQGGAGSGFRAIDAVAQMPAARTMSAKQSSQKQSVTSQPDLKAASHEGRREALLKAEIPSASAEQRDEQIQSEWIIFTAWEQVEGSGASHRGWNHDAGMRQDYDSATSVEGPAGDGNHQADDNSGGGAVGRGPITQLIFRIYPAGTLAAPQNSGAATAGTSDDQPAAMLLHDGWFIFQL